MTVQTCYRCQSKRAVERDEPYRCECGAWNQSDGFKERMRAGLDQTPKCPRCGFKSTHRTEPGVRYCRKCGDHYFTARRDRDEQRIGGR